MTETKTSNHKRELFRFVVSGFTAVGVDLGVYFLLNKSVSTNMAKGTSFVCGTLVAFVLNKYWTFGAKEKSYPEIGRFIVLYTLTLCVNIAINKMVLLMVLTMGTVGSYDIVPMAYGIAFLCATGTSTILNFIGQKFWVFKPARS